MHGAVLQVLLFPRDGWEDCLGALLEVLDVVSARLSNVDEHGLV